jgi:hypothetical protein
MAAAATLACSCPWLHLLLLQLVSCHVHQQPVRLLCCCFRRPKLPWAAAAVDAPKQHIKLISVWIALLLLLLLLLVCLRMLARHRPLLLAVCQAQQHSFLYQQLVIGIQKFNRTLTAHH